MDFLLKSAPKTEVADFYAGFVLSALHLDAQAELKDCMVRDKDLVDVWDAGIAALSTGDEETWKSNFSTALERSQDDLEACASSAKLRMVGHQLDHWWETFWGQGDDESMKQHDDSKTKNWLSLKKLALVMRFNWEIGSYKEAGKRLGDYWKTLIGEHEWVDHLSNRYDPEDEIERYPLADFYAAFFEEAHQKDFYEEIQACLIPDELHMRAHDLAFNALYPYDEEAYQKYNAVILTLGEYNWVHCHEVPRLGELLDTDSNIWHAFWEQENAQELASSNAEKHAAEIQDASEDVQRSWHFADPVQAGAAFAHMRRLVTQQKEAEDEAKTKSENTVI